MPSSPSFQPIKPLLQTGTSISSRWLSYVGLGIGVLLLLCSIQMYINIQDLLGKDTVRKDGFDFISITKTVTNETMGQPEKNLFSEQEISELKSKPFVTDVAPLVSNQFRAQFTGGNILPFKTDFLLESVDEKFIDTVPPEFKWQEGDMRVPLIISSDFLEIYNVFAPAQGLPQVSPETATNIPAQIDVSGNGKEATFNSNVVAFSDRMNSVLVPKSFLEWANKNFGTETIPGYTRIYIKTKDANNTDLISFLDQKKYKVNKDKIKFGRTKQTLQGIFTGLGVFGLMVVIMALMLFSFYLQLVIARSRDSLQLLLLLGYSPNWLSKNVSKQFVPVYIFIVLAALVLTQVLQWLFHRLFMYRSEISYLVHWSVIALALVLAVLSIITNYRLVRKLVYKLGQ
jgi:hypothetical protein